jgi:hypothetical protein
MKSGSIANFLLIGLLACTTLHGRNPQASAGGAPLSLEDVVKQWKNNVSEEVIITMIKKNGKAFTLSTEEMLELRKMGISDAVVRFLLDPSLPYAPPAPAAPPPAPVGQPAAPSKPEIRMPPKVYPPDTHATGIPPEPGLYRVLDGISQKTDLKLLLGEKQGPGVGKVMMKKGKAVGYLLGPASKTRVKESTATFYLRLPEGKMIEEILLVTFDKGDDRRKIEIGPTPDKQELKPNVMRTFDSLEVGAHLYKITTSKLTKGEYLFFLLGSAEPPKGIFGKGYDFGIDAATKQ